MYLSFYNIKINNKNTNAVRKTQIQSHFIQFKDFDH